MKTLKCNRAVLGIIAFISLLVIQILLGKTGYLIAGLIPYQPIDPFDCFAEISIHHAAMLIIGLLIILVLSKLLKLNFYFQLGDKKNGLKYFAIFTAVFALISVVLHTVMMLNNQLPVYAFPLDKRNVIGKLGFQLLLPGPAEEVVYRALPITLLSYSFGKSIKIKEGLNLEVILAAVLFGFAHVRWSINPFSVEPDYYQFIYAFVLGTIQGVVYQSTRSILYPMLMHSFSNFLMVGGGYLFTVLFS